MSKVNKLQQTLEATYGKSNPAPATSPGIKPPGKRSGKRSKAKPEDVGLPAGGLAGRSTGPANPNAGVGSGTVNNLGASPNVVFGMSTRDRALIYKDPSRIKKMKRKKGANIWVDGKLEHLMSIMSENLTVDQVVAEILKMTSPDGKVSDLDDAEGKFIKWPSWSLRVVSKDGKIDISGRVHGNWAKAIQDWAQRVGISANNIEPVHAG